MFSVVYPPQARAVPPAHHYTLTVRYCPQTIGVTRSNLYRSLQIKLEKYFHSSMLDLSQFNGCYRMFNVLVPGSARLEW